MRISDWSSDVCSSDLHRRRRGGLARPAARDERAVLDRDLATDVVFLLDVDNTLLDNGRFKADLDERLRRDFGADAGDQYWALYERERDRLGYEIGRASGRERGCKYG